MKFINTMTITKTVIGLSTILLLNIWFTVMLLEFNLYSTLTVLLVYFASIIVVAIFVLLMITHNSQFDFTRNDLVAIGIVTLFCIFNIIYFHEAFRGGRDDGVYANTALSIANNNSLYIHNDLAISYPGFNKTPKGITMQFYPGYSVWIATIFKILGYQSIYLVNFPFLFFGLLLLYSLCKYLLNELFGIVAVILLSTTFPFLWFTREIFTENIFFFITGYLTLNIYFWFKTKDIKYFLLSALGIFVLSTVRVESLPLIVMLFLICSKTLSKNIASFSVHWKLLTILGISMLTIPTAYYYLAIDPRYSGEILHTISGLTNHLNLLHHNSTQITASKGNVGNNIIQNYQYLFTYILLQNYNLYFFISFIPLALIKEAVNKHKSKPILFLFLFLIPNFYYLFNPSINLDQPWFLRRFMSVIIPFSIICFCYCIYETKKQYQILIVALLITINITLSSNILFLKEFSGVVNTLSTNIAPLFKPTDLVLVDYSNTGHYKIAEPLYFINHIHTAAVQESTLYNLLGKNITDTNNLYSGLSFTLSKKSICNFNSIYLITSVEDNQLKDIVKEKSIPVKTSRLTYNELEKTCELFRLSDNTTAESMAHVDLYQAKNYCSTIPKNVFSNNINLQVLKLDSSVVSRMQSSCTKKGVT